jgi:hypothetical protein
MNSPGLNTLTLTDIELEQARAFLIVCDSLPLSATDSYRRAGLHHILWNRVNVSARDEETIAEHLQPGGKQVLNVGGLKITLEIEKL